MITLDTTKPAIKYFVWCCDTLPFTVTRDYSDKSKPDGERRKGSYYIENGTTLCHIFWTTLWVPLLVAAVISLIILILVHIHISFYEQYSYKYGIAAFFIPEGFVLTILIIFATTILTIFGANKSGLLKLLGTYLIGIKSRVCPLVSFNTKSE